MSRVVTAPNPVTHWDTEFSIFLGGSREMEKAIDWQEHARQRLMASENVLILNPRRPDWDAGGVQDPTPGTQFHEQVSWELDNQELADCIIYNFIPDTISPITLLELGLFQHFGNVRICCPKTYHRYGNVKIVADRYGILFYEDLDDLLDDLVEMLR